MNILAGFFFYSQKNMLCGDPNRQKFWGENWRIRENKICETIWWADNKFFFEMYFCIFFQGWFFWENQKFWQRHQEFYCLYSFDQTNCARERLCRQICPANWRHVHIFNLFFSIFTSILSWICLLKYQPYQIKTKVEYNLDFKWLFQKIWINLAKVVL